MKIDTANISLSSQHFSAHQTTHSIRTVEQTNSFSFSASFTQVNISEAGQHAAASQGVDETSATPEESLDPKLQLIFRIVESLTGKKMHVITPEDLHAQNNEHHAPSPVANGLPTPNGRRAIEHSRTLYEAESVSFSAEGVIKTQDGQEIQFKLSLEMQREYFQQSTTLQQPVERPRKDPLVLNFNGTAAQLGEGKFSFDLDSDGQNDNISPLRAGSGYLVLDRNQNQQVDNGSELFGSKTGNGFAELAEYDEDKNNWIDENDSVFNKLKVWERDEQGNNTLSSLTQKKVAALYLGQTATPFNLNNDNNQTLGQIRTTGLFIGDDKQVGTIQQVDLAS